MVAGGPRAALPACPRPRAEVRTLRARGSAVHPSRSVCAPARARGVACRLWCMHIPTRSQVTINQSIHLRDEDFVGLVARGRTEGKSARRLVEGMLLSERRARCHMARGPPSGACAVPRRGARGRAALRNGPDPHRVSATTTTTEDTFAPAPGRVATTPVRELGIAHGAHAGRRADGR